MATGADDIGDDIEIGNENYCRNGTTLMLDVGGLGSDPADDEGGPSSFMLRVQSMGEFVGLSATDINGIEVQGFGNGSAVSAQQLGHGPAVLGNNSMGPGVSGISTAPGGIGVSGKSDSGIGVWGKSVSRSGVEGNSQSGFGVWGDSHSGSGVEGSSYSGSGVKGTSHLESGVFGKSPSSGSGVLGVSSSGNGVTALSQDGVALLSASTSERAGVFVSGSRKRGSSTSEGGIAQVRLVPSSAPNLPTQGSIGDLFVHQVLLPIVNAPAQQVINLYMCVNDQPVQWQQVQLAPKVYPGGVKAP
jgi:hypothetical protein